MVTVPVSPAFSPVHSFVGGLMLASGVCSLLGQVGMVVGISGFFHANVRSMLGLNGSTQVQQVKGDPQSIHHRISPADDDEKQSDVANSYTSQYFIHGLLAGGALLAASRGALESALGAPIFDSSNMGFHIGKGLSAGIFSFQAAKRFVPVAIWGGLVGFGTKLGSGCTSGHFLCGISRFSPRSIVATAVFFSVAVLTNLYSHPLAPALSPKASALLVPQAPSIWALAILQVPALLYAIVIPSFVQQRAARKGTTAEEIKSVDEQAAKASTFLIGLHFALGLAVTGMTRASKVLGFLNLSPSRIQAGQWDPSLAFVALSGITFSSIYWFLSVKPKVSKSKRNPADLTSRPFYWRSSPKWRVPSSKVIDWRLLLGAVFFGLGWGMTGLCPGPALVGFGASTLPAPQDQDALVALAYRGTFVGAVGLGGLTASLL